MSLSPTPINDVPELTAQVARAAFPNGNWYMQMRDTLGTIGYFPTKGRVEHWRGGRRDGELLLAGGFRHVPVPQSAP
jgi:hypothetical protein